MTGIILPFMRWYAVYFPVRGRGSPAVRLSTWLSGWMPAHPGSWNPGWWYPVHEPSSNKKIYQTPEEPVTMKLVSFLMILCLFGMILSAGCSWIPLTEPTQIVVSKDPTACQSIKIDCSIHEKDNGGSWWPYSDSTGCGCKRYAKWSRGYLVRLSIRKSCTGRWHPKIGNNRQE